MSNEYRLTEEFFRRYEPMLIDACNANVNEWAGYDPSVAVSTCRVNLYFAINSYLDNRWPSELRYDLVQDRFRRYNFAVSEAVTDGHRAVVWKIRGIRKKSVGQPDFVSVPRPDNLAEDRQRIDDLGLPANDKDLFRVAIRASHYGLQTQMIFLHGQLEPWMHDELEIMREEFGQTFVEVHHGPADMEPRVVIS